jgi:hypothetical protein
MTLVCIGCGGDGCDGGDKEVACGSLAAVTVAVVEMMVFVMVALMIETPRQ